MAVLSLGKKLKPKLSYATTSDGWKIALYRYLPPTKRIPKQSPVLLCHGLGANRYNLDGPGKLSLARWLCRQGFECWVIELRGAGKSTKPRFYNRKRYNWRFEHYVRHDTPAALNHIRDTTGCTDVHWIGHSMGGMVAYAYLMLKDASRIRSITAIGSPSFARVSHPLIDGLTQLTGIIKHVPHLPYAGASALMVPFMPLFKPTVGRLFGNPDNLRTIDMQKLVALVPQDLPVSLMSQFLEWYGNRGFSDGYGNVEYFRELHRIEVPALIMAGKDDRLTPPRDLKYVFDNISSEQKEFHVLGKDTGCRHDYGHIDPVLGQYAAEEVWPLISTFLKNH